MTKPHKFRPGRKILSMAELEHAFRLDLWIYLHGKPKHPSVIKSMTYQTIEGYIRKGMLTEAFRNTLTEDNKNG
jgi:hypothetical protein